MDNFLLPLLLIIPTVGAIVCALLPDAKLAKAWALLVSLGTAAIAAVMAVQFPWSKEGARIVYGGGIDATLSLTSINFGFRLAMDSVSFWLVLLTVTLQPLAIAASFESIKDRAKEYYAWMLALLAAMLGVFVAKDLLLFYIFFELTLIPMFFIIGIWGGPERRYAAGKFFLFTFAGSVFTLACVIYIGIRANTFDIDQILRMAAGFSSTERFWLFLAFLAGFSVKVPLFPVHTWLPLAHTEAPTAGSVILAGVLLKLGTYGIYKLAIPIGLLDANGVAFPTLLKVLGVLSVIGIIYGSLVAWVQQDIKKLVAYSSVAHLGFCVLGLLALNPQGVGGGGALHDQPRRFNGGDVPRDRHGLRPLSHARHRQAFGPGQAHAGVVVLLGAVHDEQHRPPGDQWVRQRVLDDPGRVHLAASGHHFRRLRGGGHRAGRDLHAAHGRPRDLRPAEDAGGACGRSRRCAPRSREA
jgi:NADH-quinone oxidoreductase subunit M